MDQPDSNLIAHYLISQAQVVILGLAVILLMSFVNSLWIYFLNLFPVLFLYLIAEYFMFWKKQEHFTYKFNRFHNCLLFFTIIIFIVFFGQIYDTATLDFQIAQNCQVTGQLTKSIESHERYSILYVDFNLDGQRYLGFGCSSNQVETITGSVSPYKFYEKGDNIQQVQQDNCFYIYFNKKRCGPHDDSSNDKHSYHYEHSYNYYYSRTRQCTTSYQFSNVKIASWFCIENNFDYEQYMKKQPCYVHFYNNEKYAKENSKERSSPKNIYSFPLISFQSHPQYPKGSLKFLIMFVFYPMLLSMNVYFQYSSNWILAEIRLLLEKYKQD